LEGGCILLKKSILDILPQKEREVYEQLSMLSPSEKELLYTLIKNVDKNGVALYPGSNEIMKALMKKGYVKRNELYKGPGHSYFVFSKAPYLLNKLRFCIQRSHTKKEIFR